MRRTIAVLAVTALMLTVPAVADVGYYATVSHNETGVSPALTMNVYAPGFAGGVNAYVGKYRWDLREPYTAGDPNPYGMQGLGDIERWGFCIEMQYSDAWQTYKVIELAAAPIPSGPEGQPMGATKADYIRELWSLHIADTTTNQGAAAFQAAVWEIVYEDAQAWNLNTWNPTNLPTNSSVMVANTTVGDLANLWLSQLDGVGPRANNLVALSSQGYQDYVVEIPAPGAIVLGLIGLGIVGKFMRRYA